MYCPELKSDVFIKWERFKLCDTLFGIRKNDPKKSLKEESNDMVWSSRML